MPSGKGWQALPEIYPDIAGEREAKLSVGQVVVKDKDVMRAGIELGTLTLEVSMSETREHRFRTWLALKLVDLAALVFYGIPVEIDEEL